MTRIFSTEALRSRLESVTRAMKVCGKILRTMLGAPDYGAYVAHVRSNHPDRPMLTRAQFAEQYLEARYNKPGSRCC